MRWADDLKRTTVFGWVRTSKLLNTIYLLPHDGILRSLVLGLALEADELHARGVEGGGDLHLDLLAQQRRLEVAFQHHLHLHLGAAHLTHQRYHAERQGDILGGAVSARIQKILTIFYLQ